MTVGECALRDHLPVPHRRSPPQQHMQHLFAKIQKSFESSIKKKKILPSGALSVFKRFQKLFQKKFWSVSGPKVKLIYLF